MKLWLRIFVSILVVSLTALLAASTYLINKNHTNNIALEQNRSLNEYDYIRTSISNNIDFKSSSKEAIKILLPRYGDYYKGRGIYLMFYHDGEYLYHNFQAINQQKYRELQSVKAETKMIRILENNNRHYILVSGLLAGENGPVFIYAREISELYHARSSSIRLTIIFTAGLILVLVLLSYLYSKWITKPIEDLQQGAIAISHGNYGVQVTETKDEFKDLATAFNFMSSAVLDRTSELENRAQELQVFIDDLSHEMNTPLTSIQGYAEFILNANYSEEQRLFAADNILKQAVRMKDIYTKLMSLTIAREQPLELTKVRVDEIFQDLHDTFMTQANQLNITLTFENKLTMLLLDRILIYMLLSNLIKNSIQALPNGGAIMIKAYEELGKSILEVSDTGFGIPMDKIKDITKPFFRIDKSRSRKTGGAGLGLTICSSIASLHHAELNITSNPGIGTSIKVILPDESIA